jgi:hypothetical protein
MDNQYKDITVFNGGLNFDDEPRNIPNGDYRYAMCCRNYDGLNANAGAITNVLGNTLIEFELPSGVNTVIGSVPNVEVKGIIYFVYNSLRKHSILQYLVESRSIEKILYDEPILGFSLDHRIYHANVLDNKLFWVDGLKNPPRKINILRAKDYTNGVGGYASLDKQTLDAVKYPPSYPPIAEFDSTGYSPGVVNNVKGRSWQFAYSYIYDDFEQSRLSEFSPILVDRFRLAPVELAVDGNFNYIEGPDYYNNKVKVAFNSGHHTVIKVLLYARDSANNTFFRFSEIDKLDQDGNKVVNDNEIITADFLNDGVYSPISIEESFVSFDSLPVRSHCQEIVDQNVLTYANNLMNYPRPFVDIKIRPVSYVNVNPLLYGTTQPNYIPFSAGALDLKFNTEVNATPDPVLYTGVSSVQITIPAGATLVHFRDRWPSTADRWILEESSVLIHTVNSTLANAFDVSAYPYSYFKEAIDYLIANRGMDDYYLFREGGFDNFVIVSSPAYPNPGDLDIKTQPVNYITYNVPNFDYSLKRGSRKRFGIIYKDEAKRTPGVVSTPDMVLDVPFFNAQETDDRAVFAEFEVNNAPPIWAHYYQFVVSQSSFLEFIQSYVKGSDITGNSFAGYKIKFNKSLTDFKSDLEDSRLFRGESSVTTWTYSNGDRVRLISNSGVEFDYPIISLDEATGEFLFSGGRNISFVSTEYYKFEVYRPQKDVFVDDDTFFTVGREFRIMNPGLDARYHNINPLPIPLPGSPSEKIGVIDYGDVYNVLRFADIGDDSTPFSSIESKIPDFRYSNELIVINRPFPKSIANSGARLSTMITSGGRLFVGTEFNDILRFDGSSSKFLNDSHGPINKIHLVGYVLKALQDVKVTSIYIGRVVVNSSDGNTRETLSNEILGTINPYVENVGCVDPGSVVSNVRAMYFFDRINGQFYRDSPNGLFPISAYKATNYFDKLSKNWGNKQMFCEFIENIGELNVTTYEEIFVQAQGIYSDDEVAFGVWQAIVPNADAAKIPVGASVTFTDQDTFFVTTTVTGKTVVGSTTIIGLQIPTPNPVPALPNETQVLVEYRQKGLGETIAFFEGDNRWKTFMPYVPNAYGRFGRTVVSFNNGQLWLHEDNQSRNRFYGAYTPSSIEFASNLSPEKIKVFDNISVYSNRVWGSPNNTDIIIPPTFLHPSGMASRLVPAKYVNKEGIFHAEFLRDLNTPGSSAHKILNGRRLRGELMLIRLTNSDTFLVTLSKVIVYSQPSEISA